MDAPATLHELQSQGELPPLVCVFVSHVDGAARHLELTCNLDFADFIAKDVIAWLRQRYPELSKDGHLICGPSLGGLASAFTALNYPEVFWRCLSQSGSFWWNDEWLTTKLGELPPSQLKIWLSVGDHETGAGVSHAPTGCARRSLKSPPVRDSQPRCRSGITPSTIAFMKVVTTSSAGRQNCQMLCGGC